MSDLYMQDMPQTDGDDDMGGMNMPAGDEEEKEKADGEETDDENTV